MTDLAQINPMADTELSRLQLQNRELKTDIRNLLDEKRSQLVTQNKMICLLNMEHDNLQLEYNTLRQAYGAKHKSEINKQLVNILDQHTEILNAYKQEKINLWELEGHIKKIEKQISALQKNKITDNCYKETIVKVQKDVVTLENRLDVVSKKCCAVLAENTKLRQSIDHMLQYRAQFNDLWQDLVAQFNNGKKVIMELIDQSIVAFDQREELFNKLQFLRDKTESDKLIHIQEMRELQRGLEHDGKLEYFYDTKGQKRINADLEERENNKKAQQREHLEKELNEYKRIISKIQELTGVLEIDKFSCQYTQQEEENFAIFNYVNELSSEVEILNEVVQKYMEDIEFETEQKKETAFKGETESIPHLESEKAAAKKDCENALDEKTTMDAKHKKLLVGIEHIFKFTESEDTPILNVLGQRNNITGQNIGLIIGVIKKKVDCIVANLSIDDFKILTKKDRVPKFNVKETSSKKK